MNGGGAGLVLAGRYRLLDQVAVGAMGEVWRAHDDLLDRDVAVKVLRPELAEDVGFLARFRTEARHAASVRHPHVAAVHDYGEDQAVTTGGVATAYLVMELLDGRPLNAVLADAGPLPTRRVAALLAQVADALAAAHRIGLVHRDVKPANLVVTGEGSTARADDVTVTDFGIARAADAVPVTRTGLVMGTAEYLSPEQARGERATTASDVYSLGVVAYELLTGQPPFTGANAAEVARAHVQDPVPALPETVPAAMRVTVARCLGKDPRSRPDVSALADRLRSVADGTAEVSGPWSEPPAPQSPGPGVTGPGDGPGTPAATGSPGTAAPARPDVPRTTEIPVVGGPGARAAPRATASRATASRATASRATASRLAPHRTRPVRAPVVALLALAALLLLATLLQALGLVGGVEGAASAAAGHVTGSSWTTIDKDGR